MSEQPKHDGKLDEYTDAQVWLKDEHIYISELETIELTAEQALSLLAWLVENKPVIEQLAKENNTSTD